MTTRGACRDDVDDVLDGAFHEGAEAVRVVMDESRSCHPCGNRSRFRVEFQTAQERAQAHAEAQKAEADRQAKEAAQLAAAAKVRAEQLAAEKAAAERQAALTAPSGSTATPTLDTVELEE